MGYLSGTAAACALLLLGVVASPQLAAQADGPRERTLVVAYPPQQFSLDPLHTFSTTEAQLFTAVYEGLVAYDPITLNPVAGQAERWEISRDRRTYTFHLRPDARFSNGDRCTPRTSACRGCASSIPAPPPNTRFCSMSSKAWRSTVPATWPTPTGSASARSATACWR